MSQTKLLFSETFPVRPSKRATHVCSPVPLVVERLLPVSKDEGSVQRSIGFRTDLQRIIQSTYLQQPWFSEDIPTSRNNCTSLPPPVIKECLLPMSEAKENVESVQRSTRFTFISEERLNAAIKRVERDLRRQRLKTQRELTIRALQEAPLLEASDVEHLEELGNTPKTKLTDSDPKAKAGQQRGKLSVHTSQKNPIPSFPRTGESTVATDPGQTCLEVDKQDQLSREIRKLQNELDVFIQKMIEVANRGETREKPLDPEEQHKLETQRQKQSSRSASNVYVLLQQVKEIQADMKKCQNQKTQHIGKFVAVNKLAAVYRGTLRALRVVIQQFSDHENIPPYHKELFQVIHQLSLCSAQVEENGSAVPELTLQILQKLETLDSAISKQEMLDVNKAQTRACPPHRKSRNRSSSPTNAPRGPTMPSVQEPRQPVYAKKDKIQTLQKSNISSHLTPNRSEILRAGLEMLVWQRVLREPRRRPRSTIYHRKGGALHPGGSRAGTNMMKQHTGFRQPTVSSQLKVNQLPQKEHSIPWKHTSPHSPPQQWSEVLSPTQWDERAEQEARERNEPLLDEAQEVGESQNRTKASARNLVSELAKEKLADSAEQPNDVLQEDVSVDTPAWPTETDGQLEAEYRLPALTEESMLLRLQEIEREQEEIRRRWASVIYSDPLSLDPPGATGSQTSVRGSITTSPQPIRFTMPVQRQTCPVNIILKEPVDVGIISESSLTEEVSQDEQQLRFPGPVEQDRRTVISLTAGTLRNIQQYKEKYEAYLHDVAHETVGSFDPWALADSLADELLSEALDDVAEEFDSIMKEYVDALFTSEFLAPPASVSQ